MPSRCAGASCEVMRQLNLEPLSPISVGDYLYEVSFPDPLAVPRGHILQVAAKQHVISTHSRDQVTHITKVCVKAVPTPGGLF